MLSPIPPIRITKRYWPTYPAAEVVLPADVASYTEQFTAFYLSKHSGRRLAWQHALGQCVLRATFATCGARELQVSLFQAAALLLFNDAPRLTFEEVRRCADHLMISLFVPIMA